MAKALMPDIALITRMMVECWRDEIQCVSWQQLSFEFLLTRRTSLLSI